MNTISRDDFRNMSLRQKGYMVQKFGHDDNQPNIPMYYHPKRRLRARQRSQFVLGGQDALKEQQRERNKE